MSLSRRTFMKAGVVTAAFAAFPLKSVMAQIQDSSSSATIAQLGYYTKSSFAPYVNTEFRVYLNTSDTLGMKLVEINDRLPSIARRDARGITPSSECFSLLLTIPQGKSFEQNTYLIEHESLGTFYLFVVPVTDKGKRSPNLYEAIIYRRQEALKGYDAAFTPGANSSKGKQEVFYFRPQEIAPPPAPPADPGAAGRLAASRMTVAQSPSILGLRLGMTTEQALSLFPGITNDAEIRSSLSRPASKLGISNLTISPGKYSGAKTFERVTQINLTFLDGRVFNLNVGYNGPLWGHVDEFVAKFSEETRLPGADSWDAYVGMDTQLKTLRGMDFEVTIFAGGENVNINYVNLRDLTAQQILKERRARNR